MIKNTAMKAASKQRGLTMISWMVVIVFFLFQGVLLMNILPVYLTDSTVSTVIDALPDDDVAKRTSAKKMKYLIIKRLKMNSVYSFKPEYIKIKKGHGEMIVLVEYEPRGTLVGDLDFIVTFKHEARIKTR